MTKAQFLQRLAHDIAGLPRCDVERWQDYYSEMLDDRIEDGMSEEEAVAAIGAPARIAKQILAETPLTTLIRERMIPKQKLPVWAIVLLALGSPVWLSLAVAAVAVVLSCFVALWAGLLSCYAVELSLIACAVGGVGLCFVELYFAAPTIALLMLGGALACAGLALLSLPLWKWLTVLMLRACKGFWLFIKRLFVRKEAKQ